MKTLLMNYNKFIKFKKPLQSLRLERFLFHLLPLTTTCVGYIVGLETPVLPQNQQKTAKQHTGTFFRLVYIPSE